MIKLLLELTCGLLITFLSIYYFIRMAHSLGAWEAHYDNPSSIDRLDYEPGTHECHE